MKKFVVFVAFVILTYGISSAQHKIGINVGNKAPDIIGQSAAWEKAVSDDKLEWPYHVSDLKGWYSKHAAVYGVRRIPSNFLIDGSGIIIGQKLHGHALESTLEKLAE